TPFTPDDVSQIGVIAKVPYMLIMNRQAFVDTSPRGSAAADPDREDLKKVIEQLKDQSKPGAKSKLQFTCGPDTTNHTHLAMLRLFQACKIPYGVNGNIPCVANGMGTSAAMTDVMSGAGR